MTTKEEDGKLRNRIELAQQVRRPMTFFTLVAIIMSSSLMGFYFMTPDEVPLWSGIVMSALAIGLSVDCCCVLFWAKAKLAKDPKAFQDE